MCADFKLVPVGAYTLEIRTRPAEKDVWVGMNRDPFTVSPGRMHMMPEYNFFVTEGAEVG